MAALEVDPKELVKDADDKPKKKATKNLPAASRGEEMSDKDFQDLVFSWATDARQYVEEFLTNDRFHATEYYKGRLPDVDKEDTEEDRSTAVLTEVRDTVLGIMPELLRIFFSAESPVKFDPVAADNAESYAKNVLAAKQATAYVQQVVLKTDNPDFFGTCHDWFQDGLVRKTGFIKWWWERSKKPSYSSHTGLSEEQALALAVDPDVDVIGKRAYPAPAQPQEQAQAQPPTYGQPPAPAQGQLPAVVPETLYDLKLRRSLKRGRLRIRAIPCENVMVARRATSMDRVTLFGYSEDKAVGDFIAEGLIDDADEVADCDVDPNDSDNMEQEARRPKLASAMGSGDNPPQDPTQRLIKYSELYITADRDGDGIPELLRVTTAGTKYKILTEEAVDDIDYAAICPYPEAHTFFGESVADLTMDVQRIKSRILRDTLDSLAQSVEPSTVVVEGKVNLDDVLNQDTSKVIRAQAPGMVETFKIPFVGGDSMPILEWFTKVREERTGMTNASNGLNAKDMQSSTQDAVTATLSKAQSRIEMIARIFSETGFKRLFRGILRTTIKNMDKPRLVVLSDSPVALDPKDWNAEMGVNTTLVFGRGSTQEQIATLTAILSKQEQVVMQFGFDNPICNIDQYTYTLQRLVELAGWCNATSFFSDTSRLDPQKKAEFLQKMTQAMAAKAGAGKSGPDPQIEQAKIASAEKIEQMKLQLASAEMQGKMQLETLKVQGNLQVAAMQILADKDNANRETHVRALLDHFGQKLDAHVTHHGNLLDSHTKLAIARMQPAEPAGGGSE